MKHYKILITIEEARRLPNILGKICSVMLLAHGKYTCYVAGEKFTYILKQS